MSNTEHYEYEAALKAHVRTMDEAILRDRLEEFVAVASVDVVRLLGSALGFKMPKDGTT